MSLILLKFDTKTPTEFALTVQIFIIFMHNED